MEAVQCSTAAGTAGRMTACSISSPRSTAPAVASFSIARVLAIVDTTSDSFSDDGAYDPVAHALKLVEEGADALDMGGESTRPGATPITEADELRRVIPVIEALAKRVEIPISVDTLNSVVMRAVVAAGAGTIAAR